MVNKFESINNNNINNIINNSINNSGNFMNESGILLTGKKSIRRVWLIYY